MQTANQTRRQTSFRTRRRHRASAAAQPRGRQCCPFQLSRGRRRAAQSRQGRRPRASTRAQRGRRRCRPRSSGRHQGRFRSRQKGCCGPIRQCRSGCPCGESPHSLCMGMKEKILVTPFHSAKRTGRDGRLVRLPGIVCEEQIALVKELFVVLIEVILPF